MFRPVSRLRHKSKRKLVDMCIEKESEGWRCIVPIHLSDNYYKHFAMTDKGYEHRNTDQNSYWTAIYEKVM